MKILITGSSSGIGLATAEAFAKDTNNTVYASVRNPSSAVKLNQLASQYQNIKVIQLDVTDKEEKIREIVDSLPPLDILINNAGIGCCSPVETLTDEDERKIMDTNYFGALKVAKAVLPAMKIQNSGHIISISSVVGTLPDPYQGAYSASKNALNVQMRVLQRDLQIAGFNIKISDINPGPVLTNFESSTPKGSRILEIPYPQMESNEQTWRKLMQEKGRPVQETVDTILSVVANPNPDAWNPTEPGVYDQFARIYKDPTGNNFMVNLTSVPSVDKTSVDALIARNIASTAQEARTSSPPTASAAPEAHTLKF